MQFRKLCGPMTFLTGSGGESVEVPLPAASGGHTVNAIGYMIKFTAVSSSNLRAGMRLDHGPDGIVWTTHSTPIAVAAAPSDNLAVGDTYSTATMIMEITRPVVLVQSANATFQTFTAEIYEMRKPF